MKKFTMYERLFNTFADIIDDDDSIAGVKCTYNDHGEIPNRNDFDVVDDYMLDWFFYNTDSEKSPYVLAMYVNSNSDEPLKFKLFGGGYDRDHDGFISWEDGIKMVFGDKQLTDFFDECDK